MDHNDTSIQPGLQTEPADNPHIKKQFGANLILVISVGVFFLVQFLVVVVISVLSLTTNYNFQSPDFSLTLSLIITALLAVPTLIMGTRGKTVTFKQRFNLYFPGITAIILCLIAGPFVQLFSMGIQVIWQIGVFELFGVSQLQSTVQMILGANMWYSLVVVAIIPGIIEEFVFRGMLLGEYAQTMRRNKAIVLSALLFALLHCDFMSLPSTFMIGILLAWLFYATNSIIPGMVLHFSFNATSVLIVKSASGTLNSIENYDISQLSGWLQIISGIIISVLGLGFVVGLFAFIYNFSRKYRERELTKLNIANKHNWAFITSLCVLSAFTLFSLLALIITQRLDLNSILDGFNYTGM